MKFETAAYLDWDQIVEAHFGVLPGDWDETDRGPEYIRFSNGETVIHVGRLKVLGGTSFYVQKATLGDDGKMNEEMLFAGGSRESMADNVLDAMNV